MKEIPFDAVKPMLVEMLSDMHAFCTAYGIRYSLTYGTLLGALRHKGFIPWDDDIDLMMPRADYERFIRTYEGKYKIASMAAMDGYRFPFAKVYDPRTLIVEEVQYPAPYGVFLDVFPVDDLPEEGPERERLYARKRLLDRVYQAKMTKVLPGRDWKKNAVLRCTHALFAPVPMGRVVRAMERNARRAEGRKAEKSIGQAGQKLAEVGLVVPPFRTSWMAWPATWFEQYETVSFEGVPAQIIAEADAFLRSFWGDYMQLPPVEQRVSHHAYRLYWK